LTFFRRLWLNSQVFGALNIIFTDVSKARNAFVFRVKRFTKNAWTARSCRWRQSFEVAQRNNPKDFDPTLTDLWRVLVACCGDQESLLSVSWFTS